MSDHASPLDLTPDDQDTAELDREVMAAFVQAPTPASGPDDVAPETMQPGSSLEYWACVGRLDQVERELKGGANVNHSDSSGYTALHAAAENNHIEIVKILLGHGADRTSKVESGETPLDYARSHGHQEIIALLERP